MSHTGDNPQPYGDQPSSPYGQESGYGGGYGGGPADPHGGGKRKGFLAALFDLSFTTFVTPSIIKVVYVIGMVGIVFATLFFAVSGFLGDSPGFGIVTLLVAPIVGLLYLCLFRMMCEFYLAITRMSEDINQRLPQR